MQEPGVFRRIANFFGQSWILAALVVIAAVTWMASGMISPSPAAGNADAGAAVVDTTIQGSAGQDSAGAEGEEQPADLLSVRVETFQAEKIGDWLRLQGRTAADRSVTVRAETGGIVSEILAERGAKVQQGQALVYLKIDERQARVDSASALVAQRTAEFDAAQRLNKKGYRGAVELSQAQAALDEAKAELEMTTIELTHTTITAPFSGVMNDRDVEIGDFVDRADPVAYIVDLSLVTAVGQISERHLGAITKGQPARIRVMDEILDGTVSYVGSIADEQTRTFPVEVDISNEGGTLIEGITVELNLPLRQVAAHTLTPSILTLSDDGDLGVRGVNENDEVVFYPVEILSDTPNTVVLGGLPDRVRLITVGQEFVREGQQVIPVEQAPAVADIGGSGS